MIGLGDQAATRLRQWLQATEQLENDLRSVSGPVRLVAER